MCVSRIEPTPDQVEVKPSHLNQAMVIKNNLNSINQERVWSQKGETGENDRIGNIEDEVEGWYGKNTISTPKINIESK